MLCSSETRQLQQSHGVKAFSQAVIVSSSRIIILIMVYITFFEGHEFFSAETLFPAVALLYVLQNTMLKRLYICAQFTAEALTSISRIQVYLRMFPLYLDVLLLLRFLLWVLSTF